MANSKEKQLIGISKAAEFLGWSAGKFGGYYYSNRTPPHKIKDNKPAWIPAELLEWVKSVKRSNAKDVNAD